MEYVLNIVKFEKKGGICVTCNDDCFFLGSKTSTEVICLLKNESVNGYYRDSSNQNLYYRCLDNCASCKDESTCTECKSGYAYKEFDRSKCYPKTDFEDYYYTKDQGISYQKCDDRLCKKCYFSDVDDRTKCYLCEKGFYVDASTGKCEAMFGEVGKIILINDTHYDYCSKLVDGCNNCIDKNTCQQCQSNYAFLNGDKTRCFQIEELKNGYILDPSDASNYISCEKIYDNCNACNETICFTCKEDFFFVNDDFSKCI